MELLLTLSIPAVSGLLVAYVGYLGKTTEAKFVSNTHTIDNLTARLDKAEEKLDKVLAELEEKRSDLHRADENIHALRMGVAESLAAHRAVAGTCTAKCTVSSQVCIDRLEELLEATKPE